MEANRAVWQRFLVKDSAKELSCGDLVSKTALIGDKLRRTEEKPNLGFAERVEAT